MNTRSSIWRSDSLEFRSPRWLKLSTGDETVRGPRGTFIPWSAGLRFCLIFKTAHVEFKLEIVRQEGETEQDARDGMAAMGLGSSPKSTLQINRPQDVELR
ncbi:putative cytochrome p450 monooxygenase protein [Botrytis fragariae]|uniref:Putative cytochrome p450 monooxygenase protein n=1 Tax=Botrytis fragariae TaxID=1964551 RepID=A0A8H6EGM1_9HELO|nr:putative cytochrome p450 monooxygenase protein [Botrytis fragariae]KAF5871634.1 putative cytochrome p450 monooxygenase protein [Botrytis fragariae]